MGARQSEVVRQALEFLRRGKGRTRHAVAKAFGISPSTLYRALQRKEKK